MDDDRTLDTEHRRIALVAKVEVSASAKKKVNTKKTADGDTVHSFRMLPDDLSTVVLNLLEVNRSGGKNVAYTTEPTTL